jgi:hypothetical protein
MGSPRIVLFRSQEHEEGQTKRMEKSKARKRREQRMERKKKYKGRMFFFYRLQLCRQIPWEKSLDPSNLISFVYVRQCLKII